MLLTVSGEIRLDVVENRALLDHRQTVDCSLETEERDRGRNVRGAPSTDWDFSNPREKERRRRREAMNTIDGEGKQKSTREKNRDKPKFKFQFISLLCVSDYKPRGVSKEPNSKNGNEKIKKRNKIKIR